MTEREAPSPHVDDLSMANYVDNVLRSDERAPVESHLAECAECRDELVAVRRLVRRSRRRWIPSVPSAFAAAAAVLLVIWLGTTHQLPSPAMLRDRVVTAALAPRPLSPVGTVARLDSLRWTAVPDAHRYRITLFSDGGQMLWQATTKDTSLAIPDSLRTAPTPPHYWQVKAETAYGRWLESELVAFTVSAPAVR